MFAGGCFWCTEAVFQRLKGVKSVVPGYTGGRQTNPTYEQVCSGATGHAEAIKIEYDPAAISFETLLAVFFTTHDPTTLNRQGADVGPQYRSAVFYTNEEQRRVAQNVMQKLRQRGAYDKPIVTELKPFDEFYQAEEKHRQFYLKNRESPYCRLVINPKLDKLKKTYESFMAS